jgi:L,D-transpeptidase ErfK/SrfK
VVGRIEWVEAQEHETLVDIARRYKLGYQEIVLANPDVDPWLPGEGTQVVVPNLYVLPDAPRDGIVLNLAEMRLYYYPKTHAGQSPTVVTYPVSIGRMDWKTPLGLTRVERKVKDPAWYPPESIRIEHAAQGDILPELVPAGPDNPLGGYALYLGVSGYLLHGTNKPFGIGMRVTHGCVRLYPEDVEALYHQVPVGTPVRIVDQPYKIGWRDGTLYLEAHPPFGDPDLGEAQDLAPLVEVIVKAKDRYGDQPLAWERAQALAEKPSGFPLPLSEAQQQDSALDYRVDPGTGRLSGWGTARP